LSQAQDSSLTHSTLQLRATMSAIRHPCLIMGQCPSNFEGRNTWALANVISGSPIVFEPFVMGARHAAEYRNWYWAHKRREVSDRGIHLSSVEQYYPTKSDMISDRPASDSGGNFGRLARAGVMEGYIAKLFEEKLAGIRLSAWQQFFSIFT
ncbi:MAG: hypothetical protein BECKG1743E_GA0114224_109531, partial [Candidatus Kentron sp. G]